MMPNHMLLIQLLFIAAVIGISLDLVNGRGTAMVIGAILIFLMVFLKDMHIDRLEQFCYVNPDYPKCHEVIEWREKFTETEDEN